MSTETRNTILVIVAGLIGLCCLALVGLAVAFACFSPVLLIGAGAPAPITEEYIPVPAEEPAENPIFTCNKSEEDYAFIIGGKDRAEGIGTISMDFVHEGAPLQEWFEQVTDEDFENLTSIEFAAKYESFNDFGQYIIYCQNGVRSAVKVDRDPKDGVWFGDLSFIEAWAEDDGELRWVLCNKDTGTAGTFSGEGKTCENFWSIPLSELYNDADFLPYIEMFEATEWLGSSYLTPSNGHIEMFLIFTKPAE